MLNEASLTIRKFSDEEQDPNYLDEPMICILSFQIKTIASPTNIVAEENPDCAFSGWLISAPCLHALDLARLV